MTITIVHSGPPRGKGRPRSRIARSRAGHSFIAVYTDAQTRKYEAGLRGAAIKVMGQRPPLAGPLSVVLRAFMPIPASWPKWKRLAAEQGKIYPTGKPDIDNILKELDSLNEVVWRDDSQIVVAAISKVYDVNPRLSIEITGISV